MVLLFGLMLKCMVPIADYLSTEATVKNVRNAYQ